MNTRTRFIGTGLLIAACAIAFAAQDAITLKFAPKEGTTLNYKMNASIDAGGATVTVAANVTNKVTKVDANGYTIAATQSNLKINFNGQEMDQPDSSDTTTYKSNGEVVEVTAEQTSDSTYRVAELTNFVYPDKAVKVGDTWTYKVQPDDKKGLVAATADYKVDSTEKIGTHDTFKIKLTYKEDGASGAESDGYVWIDTTDGSMVKSTSTWTNVPLGPGGGVNGTVTVERAD